MTVTAPGINAKMNEIQASFGLLQLKHVDEAIAKRRTIADSYRKELQSVKGIRTFSSMARVELNASYFPILVQPDYSLSRDGLYAKLKEHGIYSRRYFYPLISTMPMYRNLASSNPANLPVANRIASEVLCLPIYPDLSGEDIEKIVSIISGVH